MGKQTSIEWADDSWNPWQGCVKVSSGCKFCYMYRDKKRYGQDPSTVVRSKPPTFNAPLTKFEGPLIFTCSWSDFFIEQADEWRDEAWDIIKQTPHLTYQILTKRPENIQYRLPADWGKGWENVWLGVSVENQDYVWRIHELDRVPALIRFVSYEPALGPIMLKDEMQRGMIDWLIGGGESGPDFRQAWLDWFMSVQYQCQFYGVPYFHKQNGGSKKIDGVWGGRELNGRTWSEMPLTNGNSCRL